MYFLFNCNDPFSKSRGGVGELISSDFYVLTLVQESEDQVCGDVSESDYSFVHLQS